MAGSAVNNSSSRVWIATTAVTAGDFTVSTGNSAFDLGVLAEEGTEVGNAEVVVEGFFVGDASTGGTYTATVRLLGSTVVAAVTTAYVANPPTKMYLAFPNISLTRYTEVAGYCGEPSVDPASSTSKRTSWSFTFTAKGDAISDFLIPYVAGAITVPTQ